MPRIITVEVLKSKCKDEILKAVRKNNNLLQRNSNTIIDEFLSETTKARIQLHNILKMLKEN